MQVTITANDQESNARTTTVLLAHGPLHTPAFVPVATRASIRGLESPELHKIGYEMLLANSFHLYLQPGHHTIQELGGLHNFMDWEQNILTDSGGYQIFSLAQLTTIYEEGVCIRSPIDGSKHNFTPQQVIDIQQALGSDIIMPLDQCTPPDIEYREAQAAVQRSIDWLRVSRDHQREKYADSSAYNGELFGIIQGNFYPELRTISAQQTVELNLAGYAIGGLSVGESQSSFYEILAHTTPLLPTDKLRYVMGIGTPDYILEAVAQGIDIFDCVYPTRVARNGVACTSYGLLNLKHATHRSSNLPLDSHCACKVCVNYSRAYLRHLFKCREMLAPMLLTYHNLYFYQQFMLQLRQVIHTGQFQSFSRNFLQLWHSNSHE